jgi:hypothetical protein
MRSWLATVPSDWRNRIQTAPKFFSKPTPELKPGACECSAWRGFLPDGFTTWIQIWIVDAGAPDGFAASNALSLRVGATVVR